METPKISPYDVEIEGISNEISKTDNTNVKKWVKESNDYLKHCEQDYKVVNKTFYDVIIFILILVIIIGIILAGWGVVNNKFKSDINQDVNINPLFNATVDTNISNSYSFNPNTLNSYNHTIIINNKINIDESVCNKT